MTTTRESGGEEPQVEVMTSFSWMKYLFILKANIYSFLVGKIQKNVSKIVNNPLCMIINNGNFRRRITELQE
jgi:hypothetical protein